MPHDIVKAMRNLREEMRQRLLLVPEYRALVALDRSIEEIAAIVGEQVAAPAVQAVAPEAHAAPAAEAAPQPAAPLRANAIASAFAETLAAKMDQRPGLRPSAPYPLAARAG